MEAGLEGLFIVAIETLVRTVLAFGPCCRAHWRGSSARVEREQRGLRRGTVLESGAAGDNVLRLR